MYVARGLLVESQNAVWLYGTASEHATLYQYSFYGATNVVAGLVQTETPYYQPTPRAPIPFENTVGMFFGDTDFACGKTEFDGCDSSWGLVLDGCKDVYIASAGIYSWFSTYSQSCSEYPYNVESSYSFSNPTQPQLTATNVKKPWSFSARMS